jgi:methylphosphotriester-DNA--protein-cysteine methyltransferase
MTYREIRPRGPAREFVECYWVLESDASESGRVQRVVPDGTAQLILNLAHPFESWQDGEWSVQPRCFLAGQITGPLLLRPTGPAKMLGVRFLAHGAGRMLGTPMPETTGRILELADIAPQLSRDLQRVCEIPSADAQADRADAIFAAWERRHGRPDPVVEHAVARLSSAPAPPAVVAQGLGINLRQLERRFQSAVGLGPKQFARMRRFQRVFQAIDNKHPGWARAAAECGYYDQAHLVRDFREFAGQPPSVLVAGADLAKHFMRGPDVDFFQDGRWPVRYSC